MALLPADVRPLGLRPVAFRYREPWGDPTVPRIGLIAEEVAEAFPAAVVCDPEGRPEGIDYRILTREIAGAGTDRLSRAVRSSIASLSVRF